MRLSREFIHELLTIGRGGPRLLHESAVQMDVWTAFGERPNQPFDVLLTPMDDLPAARLASEVFDKIAARLKDPNAPRPPTGYRPTIFPLEGFVAVCATRDIFLQVLAPMTGVDIAEGLARLQDLTDASHEQPVTLQGLLNFARDRRNSISPDLRITLLYLLMSVDEPGRVGAIWDDKSRREDIPADAKSLFELLQEEPPISVNPPLERARRKRSIWQIAGNRTVRQLGRSADTVKADAARRVFKTSARNLTWAVIDSGIDGAHPAFRDHAAGGFETRVTKAYDFSGLRRLAAYDVLLDEAENNTLLQQLKALGLAAKAAKVWVEKLREDAKNGRPFDWAVLSQLLETRPDDFRSKDPDVKPNGHGTHVAGVLGGDWREDDKTIFEGVCPDIRLYDLRILSEDDLRDTEFAVIAALEFIRWINARNRHLTVHGVNLSIGLEHDVRNFACGQTPVCRACDATVRSGVVVVVAAGNAGYRQVLTGAGALNGYSGITIADPGNTESVITVGSTHRDRPHEYGVSYFSSRGPTGDGRRKPDLVAPGEKIDGPLPELGFGRLDGTSMSAPHVSGVAALLMARHAELVGQPMTIKQILIDTATDLGRERDFQGAGLVDALRALQSQ